jgi:hypothetical protein
VDERSVIFVLRREITNRVRAIIGRLVAWFAIGQIQQTRRRRLDAPSPGTVDHELSPKSICDSRAPDTGYEVSTLTCQLVLRRWRNCVEHRGLVPIGVPIKRAYVRKSLKINLAEGVGFEPTDPCGSPVFKTGPLSQLWHPSNQL